MSSVGQLGSWTVGQLAVGGRRSAVGGRRSAVGGRRLKASTSLVPQGRPKIAPDGSPGLGNYVFLKNPVGMTENKEISPRYIVHHIRFRSPLKIQDIPLQTT
jgi:hypothetical protein